MSDENKKPYTRADYGREDRYNPGRVLGPFEAIIDTRRLEATVDDNVRLRADLNAAELRGQDTGLALAYSQVRAWLSQLECVSSSGHVHAVREAMKAFLQTNSGTPLEQARKWARENPQYLITAEAVFQMHRCVGICLHQLTTPYGTFETKDLR